MIDEEFVGIYGKVPKSKLQKFKEAVRHRKMVQNFAIEEALENWSKNNLGSEF
jgi:hypothetical protein